MLGIGRFADTTLQLAEPVRVGFTVALTSQDFDRALTAGDSRLSTAHLLLGLVSVVGLGDGAHDVKSRITRPSTVSTSDVGGASKTLTGMTNARVTWQGVRCE